MSHPGQPGDDAQAIALEVVTATDIADPIRELVLRPVNGDPLPAFTPGAHLRFQVADGQWNAYSLITLPGEPPTCRIAVRREEAGAGGSRFMHALKPGDRVWAQPPRNDFALDDGAGPALLIAGGIGLTPLISMATDLEARGRDFRLVLAARNRGATAYADRLADLFPGRVTLHLDDVAGGPLPVAALIADAAPGTHVYVCGPRPMIEATRAAWAARALPDAQFHTELFDAPQAEAGDQPFEVELASTGQVFTVPPGKTIIEVLESGGVDLVYDCQRGDCGICQTGVLDGIPDHRDVVLSPAEREAGKLIHICVSRAKSARLKLDL